MKLAVIGAGLMGRAAVYDFAQGADVEQIGVYDINPELAQQVASKFGGGKAKAGRLDAGDEEAAAKVLSGYDAAISCVTYRYNPGLTRAAIRGKCHLVDLGGNNDTVRIQLGMDGEAAAAGVVIVPDCGLAPGMVSVLVADGVSRMEQTESVRIRVGGLPQSPRPPLNYQMLFSAEGLINEYWEPCLILEGGRKKTVNPMTAVEEIEFDGLGKFEAFYTSGGTSTLPDTYEGKVEFLDYKTIRYPGHCALFRPMLELGLASRKAVTVDGAEVEPRGVFRAVLDRSLSFNEPDMTLVRVTVDGTAAGQKRTVVYEAVDRQDSKAGLTSMMRMTSFPAAVVTQMAGRGQIAAAGCKPQEVVVSPGPFIQQLRKRGINIEIGERTG
ncbi:MAG TPA: saccharopine dehydrogenase C-terminal domain-containing protein [candidate division Zixibacteria bacterium]|nr:saccharopine dehydrogenase NADP-binding domain-containing protein [candidate division Zixibacteria bacterium]MDD4916235.1 saccharopine dehydrogenase C-terminal domain-containing protein [candidate division Zixibacteria bacterium]MDM7972755.1 saccharopine dehydrogenase C-terminal domain-containing protein [candidate division Zixibacteria bacterium]HPM37540.1 saccharopine dehydrogenase C-terminal domain-containing protein [candidate division Zixibacteria bacterium]